MGEIKMDIHVKDMPFVIAILDEVSDGLDRIEKESIDASSKFWAAKLKQRLRDRMKEWADKD